MQKTSSFTGLEVNAWIKPYIHQNMTELITNLATSVQNKFLSKQTASEISKEYSTPQEWDRIIKEHKEQQEADLLYEMEQARNAAKISASAGTKVSVPRQRETDANGNRPGENNWKNMK